MTTVDSPLRARRRFYRRPWFWVLVVVLLVVAALAIIAAGALIARDRLQAVVPLTSTLKDQLVAGDTAGATLTALEIQENTGEAAAWTGNPAWRLGELVPGVGANLTAVRVAAEASDLLADDAIVPMSGVQIEALKPVNKVFDVAAIADMEPAVVSANEAVSTARANVLAVDRDSLIGPVADAVDELQSALDDASGITQAMSAAVQILPAALSDSEPRNYLMIFQNNAEVRATGGNPAALLLVTVHDGAIAIGQQASSTDFSAAATPITTLDPETQAIFGDAVGTRLRDSTMTPDFPTSAALVQAWWQSRFGTTVDGVFSFDPVALSYLVKATGPIALPTGDQLTSDGLVPLVLSEVYARYPRTTDQDAFFAATSAAVFETVASGQSALTGLLPQLSKATEEGRLLFWSSRPDEQALLAGSRIAGTLPADNVEATTVGVYLNDFTLYKMSYYLDATVTASAGCARGDVTTQLTLASSAPIAGAGLPSYVVGPVNPGVILTDAIVYGPVGASVGEVLIDGAPATVVASAQIAGRPVVRVSVPLQPGQQSTVAASFTGATGELGEVEVRWTPMVRATELAVSEATSCG